MQIAANSRQIPKQKVITSDKDYCDLLYAWLQCNSERAGIGRRILKKDCKWQTLERRMARFDEAGNEIKLMSRKTIAKYFTALLEKGLIIPGEDDYYYLRVLENEEACLIEFNTLSKLLNVFQRNCISIYIYLFNRYYAAGFNRYQVTIANIKDYIGIATSTTSNNLIIDDTLDILKRLRLLDYQVIRDNEGKSHIEIQWVKNRLD